ncbi:DUF1127 domain-containing protein [Acidisoma cellulosilytica]|uniref:DUF1127 domain-containing protein n=1 Tax=Acidisoma cellulosilyticum TaxID=2802395 RepID=A0A964E378_9PROT|nr:DUF1127 domain-containing protein [Acidisoma cellulosilyticum]MCB8879573.1 DUF1127 domain-containing protein [Acidisoma cellulosilyticum]
MTILTETSDTRFAPTAGTQAIDFLGLTLVANAVKRLVAFVRVERQSARARLQMVRELNTYTDRELAELGLTRFEIRAVAAGTYRA